MKRNRMKLRALAAVLAASCICCTAGLAASAAVTVDDVANKARELGFPEAQVQTGYNYWATGAYTQEDLDLAWEYLLNFEKESNEKFESIFESDSSTASSGTESAAESSTSASSAADSTASQDSTASGSSTSSTDSTASTESIAPTESTSSSGSGNAVSSVDFINMTLDEKIAYVNSMSPEEKDAFLANLSPEERKSIMKQMSIDDKADLMEGYIGVAEQMGMNVVVDNLTDDNISLTIRDDEGVIIDQSAMGVTIDETGISYTGLLAAAAAGVVLAVGGLICLYRYICRSDEQMQ